MISISLTLTSTGLAKNFVSEVTILMLKTILPDLTVVADPENLKTFLVQVPTFYLIMVPVPAPAPGHIHAYTYTFTNMYTYICTFS
jgi:hypothetical protein